MFIDDRPLNGAALWTENGRRRIDLPGNSIAGEVLEVHGEILSRFRDGSATVSVVDGDGPGRDRVYEAVRIDDYALVDGDRFRVKIQF